MNNLIKISKLALDLGVSKNTLWNWKKKGILEFHTIGGLNFVDRATYNRLLCIEDKKEE